MSKRNMPERDLTRPPAPLYYEDTLRYLEAAVRFLSRDLCAEVEGDDHLSAATRCDLADLACYLAAEARHADAIRACAPGGL